MSPAMLTTVRRALGAAVLLMSLSGCVLDGFTLRADAVLSDTKAVEPVADRAAFVLNDGAGTRVYSRFVRLERNQYAWESWVDNGKEVLFQVLEANFVVVNAEWTALQWRDLSGELRGVHLVRFASGGMEVAEVSRSFAQLDSVIAPSMNAKVSKEFGGRGLSLELDRPQMLLPFLQDVGRMGMSRQTHAAVAALPQALLHKPRLDQSRLVAALDLADVQDPNRTRRMLAYFRTLHDEGSGLGSFGYARFASNAWGMSSDAALAQRLAIAAIERGVTRAHTVLGMQAYYGLTGPADPAAALRHLTTAAQAGDGRAMYGMGLLYFNGEGVPASVARAVEWFERAVSEGVPMAKVVLADLLRRGTSGVARNEARAIELLDQAIDAKQPMAFEQRALMHARGLGGPVDEAAASRLYLLAAKAGLPSAQWQIGERLVAGRGVAADGAAGLAWVEKAAASGHAEAQGRLEPLRRSVAAAPAVAPAKSGDSSAADPNAAYADAMIKYLDERTKVLEGTAQATRARIDQLDARGAQLERDIEDISRRQRTNMLALRKLSAIDIKLMGLLTERIDIGHRLVADRGALLQMDLDAVKRARVQAEHSAQLQQLQGDLQKRAVTMGKNPDVLGWRLPSGRVVLPRPDGTLVALKTKAPEQGLDAAKLPRNGDQWVKGRSSDALVDYENAWTGAPVEDTRTAGLVRKLNELIGQYQCDERGLGGIRLAERNTQQRGPAIAVDAHRVLRYRTQQGDRTRNLWFEHETFVPLSKLQEIELQTRSLSPQCAIVVLRCVGPRSQCAVVSGDDAEVSTSVGVSIHFASEGAARQAEQPLRDLLGLSR